MKKINKQQQQQKPKKKQTKKHTTTHRLTQMISCSSISYCSFTSGRGQNKGVAFFITVSIISHLYESNFTDVMHFESFYHLNGTV